MTAPGLILNLIKLILGSGFLAILLKTRNVALPAVLVARGAGQQKAYRFYFWELFVEGSALRLPKEYNE